jgi:hypothetical protein
MGFNTQPQMPYNQISQKAFSNQGTIADIYGQANQGTFTRSVGDNQAQVPTNPLTGQVMDPTMDQSPDISTPPGPPAGVQMPITPDYDLNY